MSIEEMTGKVKELQELKALAEELEEEIKTIEDALKAEMTARDTEEIRAGTYKVRWTRVTSSRLDTTAIKRELPELAQKYTKTTTTRRFTVA